MTLANLSRRRREVAVLVGLNYTRAQIAAELGMKLSTVHSTIQQIAARLPPIHDVPAMRLVRGWVISQHRPAA